MDISKNVFVVGYMGAGKSTTGKKIASRLGMEFMDLDEYITLQEGMTPAEIIRKMREGYFREIEYRYLKVTSLYTDTLVSVGGGAPCYKDAMDWMLANGIVIYLEASPELVFSRVSQAKTDRPMLRDLEGDALLAHIKKQMAERIPYYKKAHLIVDAASVNAEKLDDIAREVRKLLNTNQSR